MPPSYKKARKRLYKHLRYSQQDDVPLTAPMVLAIKHHLRHHLKCKHVFVAGVDHYALSLPRFHSYSSFLLSQLEAQKLTDPARRSTQLCAALCAAQAFLAREPIQGLAFPTLFSWFSKEVRRTYHLFAYLDTSMAAHRYTSAELLELRDNARNRFASNAVAKIARNPDSGKTIQMFCLILRPLISLHLYVANMSILNHSGFAQEVLR